MEEILWDLAEKEQSATRGEAGWRKVPESRHQTKITLAVSDPLWQTRLLCKHRIVK
jgi:hypothetical protein